MKKKLSYSIKEEIWSSAIHGFGAVFGVASLAILVVLASVFGNVWSIVSCAIFGASMILMYSASTIYHAIPFPNAKKVLKKIDHIAIYYLIAGTYTPFLLVLMNNSFGWTMFGIVWGLTLIGTFLKLYLPANGTKIWSIGLYLAMGWMVVFSGKRLFDIMPTVGLVFLVLGGLFYTLGVAFYVWKSKAYMHAVWHGFVLLGSMMHFFAILFSCVFLN